MIRTLFLCKWAARVHRGFMGNEGERAMRSSIRLDLQRVT